MIDLAQITLSVRWQGSIVAEWSEPHASFKCWMHRNGDGQWGLDGFFLKDPPIHMGKAQPGYFKTRKLKLTAKSNAAIAERLARLVVPETLDEMVKQFEEKQAAFQLQERKDAVAHHKLLNAAPFLLVALKHAQRIIPQPDPIIDEAIAKAEGSI